MCFWKLEEGRVLGLEGQRELNAVSCAEWKANFVDDELGYAAKDNPKRRIEGIP